jgi:hypothetical protein
MSGDAPVRGERLAYWMRVCAQNVAAEAHR